MAENTDTGLWLQEDGTLHPPWRTFVVQSRPLFSSVQWPACLCCVSPPRNPELWLCLSQSKFQNNSLYWCSVDTLKISNYFQCIEMNSHKFCRRTCDGGRRGSVWHKSSCQWREMSWEKITVVVILLKLKGNKCLHVTKTCPYFFFFFLPHKSWTKSDTAPVLTEALTVSPQKGKKEEEKALNQHWCYRDAFFISSMLDLLWRTPRYRTLCSFYTRPRCESLHCFYILHFCIYWLKHLDKLGEGKQDETFAEEGRRVGQNVIILAPEAKIILY